MFGQHSSASRSMAISVAVKIEPEQIGAEIRRPVCVYTNGLEDILNLHTGLVSLYAQVIEEARKQNCFDIALRSLTHLKSPLSVDDLSSILLTLNK